MSISEIAIAGLEEIFGERLIARGDRRLKRYDHDMVSAHEWHRVPEAVVFPEDTAEVAALMRWATTHQVPVTARGGGSGLAAGAIAADGGVVCSLDRMNRVLSLAPDNLAVTVEPGVVTRELDASLAEVGLFFAGYPMSEEICTIGGNVATNAGGGRAVKYGVTAAHVLGLQVVLASGEVLDLGGKRLKDVTGLNLLPMFVGSEGILGIITRVTLRLTPRPASRLALLATFPDAAHATAAVASLRRAAAGVPSSIEYIDGPTARGAAAQLWHRGDAPFSIADEVGALLLVEAEGRDDAQCRADLASYRALVSDGGGEVLVEAGDSSSLEAVWKLRKAVPWWVKRRSGEYHSVEDVVVPTTEIPALVARAIELEGESGLDVAIFGHAGDGNFHINPMKPESMAPEHWDTALHDFLDRLYAFAIERGGTISGEHGIGRKRVYAMGGALAGPVLEVQRRLKATLDPDNLLNPGVLLP